MEEFVEDDVFPNHEDNGLEATTLMLGTDKTSTHRNGSMASGDRTIDYNDVNVKIPDERKSLTKSAEDIHTVA